MKMCGRVLAASVLFVVPQDARAATLDGAALTWPFVLPFAGLLLSIALGPLLFPKVWHAHYGKIAAAWSILTLASLGWFAGGAAMSAVFVHAMLAEYLSFIVLLFALYTVAGGILVTGDIREHAMEQRDHPRARLVDGEHRRHHGRGDDPGPAADPREYFAATQHT
jgi:hypothetical protein